MEEIKLDDDLEMREAFVKASEKEKVGLIRKLYRKMVYGRVEKAYEELFALKQKHRKNKKI